MTELWLNTLLKQAALLSAGVLIVAALRPWMLKRLGATAAYAAWTLVPLLLLTPWLPRPAQEPLHRLVELAPGLAALPAPARPAAPKGLGIGPLVLGLWALGALGVLGVQTHRQRQLRGQSLPAGSSPALVGLLRPRVLLPEDFAQRFTPAQQALVLAHEAVHRARHDNAWRALACALTALHWWNPLAWWGARLMQTDQELACDAAVLARHPGCAPTYTQALLAAHGLRSPQAPLASRWGSTHPLVERIAMLTRQPQSARLSTAVVTLSLIGLTGASYAALGVTTEPPVVDGFVQLELKLDVQIDGEPMGRPKLITFPGAPTSITLDGPNDPHRHWALTLRTTFASSDHLLVEAQLRHLPDDAAQRAWWQAMKEHREEVGEVVASPRLLIRDGGSGRFQMDFDHGAHRFDFTIQANSFRAPSPVIKAPS